MKPIKSSYPATHILNPAFEYRNSSETNVAATFRKARREQAQIAKAQAEQQQRERQRKVTPIQRAKGEIDVPYYKVVDKEGKEPDRMIEAPTAAQAVRHVAKRYDAKALDTAELAAMFVGGAKLERAKGEPNG